MDNLKIANNLMGVIVKAGKQDENKLRLARKSLIKLVTMVGAKRFVAVAADVLKNNFRIEGCNDVRVPLKRIFTISLEELKEHLSGQKYHLPEEHPVNALSADHKDNIKKLESLSADLMLMNNDMDNYRIEHGLEQAKDYYAELDLHIRKEEEVLFPALEKNGMQEHPQNLREEHKSFREALSKIIATLQDFAPENRKTAAEVIKMSKEKFISDICNHIFRETYVFYPAALEFITDAKEWTLIEEGFERIK